MPALGPSVRPIRELPLAGVSALECRSRQQFCALGPPPPRTPGRADPQVPATPRPGSVRHGRIAHLYFYPDERLEDAAFGLLDLEIAVCQPSGGRSTVELYGIGDGYQTGTGTARGMPLALELRDQAGIIAVVRWSWPDIVTGRAEVMNLQTDIAMTDAGFAALDRVALPPATGWVLIGRTA